MQTLKQYWWIAVLALVALALFLARQSGSAGRAWAQAVSMWHGTRRNRAEAELVELDKREEKIVDLIEGAEVKAAESEAKAVEIMERADLPTDELKRKIDDLYD
jgi:predicted  nucleic acid-binding Zn-ribbon protein